MKQNFIYRSASLIAFALLTVLVLPLLLLAAESDANIAMKGNDSPQALLATYRQALAKKEWRTCFLCYDPKMRAEFLSRLFYGVAVKEDAKLAEIIDKRLGNKLDNIDKVAVSRFQQETRAAKELRMYEALQTHLHDLPGFVDEICRRLDALGEMPFTELGDVRYITIKGNEAVGYQFRDKQHAQQTADKPQSVHFRKIDGRWYMTIPDPPPPLSVSERAKQLKSEVDSILFDLCCSSGAGVPTHETDKSKTAQPPAEKQYGELRMSVQPYVYQSPGRPVYLVRLTPAQANKLIDYLATEGFLQHAVELGKQEPPERNPSENCYTLQVLTQNLQMHEDLGWGAGMVKRLHGLRGALNGEAAQAIDKILAQLGDEHKTNGER